MNTQQSVRKSISAGGGVDYTELPDSLLLSRIQEQDIAAFEHLYDRHAQIVYNLILRIGRDTQSAEELVQETFWQVWKKAADYRGTGAPAAWIYRIARNKCLDRLRQQKRAPQMQALQSDTEHYGAGHGSHSGREHIPYEGHAGLSPVETEVAQQIDQQQLQEALILIPHEQRVCLELAYFQGMSQRQISDHIDTPLGTVKTRIRMGLGKLEYILRAAGYREEDF